nr:hypothetical protein GCM10025730_11310 [Promicromonospora thailandica]
MTRRIEDYGIVGDLQTAALVGRDGAVDWMCLPQFDSPACFAALLGDESHGSWRLGPAAGGECTRRRYRDGTLILETEWDLPEGQVRVIDLMPPRGDQADLVRVVEGISGRVPMTTVLRLRFDYGHVVPWVTEEGRALRAVAGPDSVRVDAGVPLSHDGVAEGSVLRADFTVGPGERVPFVLTYHASHLPTKPPVEAAVALRDTEEFWHAWLARSTYDGPWADAVHRSLITLKALTFAPTGAIAAAATTSLPEQLGGSRNWDYRYCWLRDAAFTLQALVGTGFVDEARAWRAWLLRAAAGDPADLQIMYGLDGRRRLPEYTLDWLPGFGAPRRCVSATVRWTSSRSTSGARCWTPCTWRARRGWRRTPRRGSCRRRCWTTSRSTGTTSTTGCGRSADRGARSCTRGSWRGPASTGLCARWRTAAWRASRSNAGEPCATASTPTSARTGTTPIGTRSRSSTVRAGWTRRCC